MTARSSSHIYSYKFNGLSHNPYYGTNLLILLSNIILHFVSHLRLVSCIEQKPAIHPSI